MRCLLIVVFATLAAAASGAQPRLVNLFALVDAPEGGVYVMGYPAQSTRPPDLRTWVDNGARIWVWSERNGLDASASPWLYAQFTPEGDEGDGRGAIWGYVRPALVRMVGPVRPSTRSVRGAGIAPEIVDVFADPPRLAVGSGDGYLNLRTGPTTEARVLVRIPNDAEVTLDGCAVRADGAVGRWCLASYEAEVPCDDGPYCPGPQFEGYLYTAALFVSCNLQDSPSDPADPCFGRVGRQGPKYEPTH